jgi:pheromone shutdown protein TraB
METKAKGRTTIRTAAVCFMISAVFELLDIAAPVPLLGGVRSGVAAMGYHLAFAGVFLGMGVGLWTGKPWGYRAVMSGTALYALDRVQMLLARGTFADFIRQQFTTPTTREILNLVPRELLLQVMTVSYLFLVLCWLGFALYIHLRRAYFTAGGR